MPIHNIKNQKEIEEIVEKSGTVVIDCYAKYLYFYYSWCNPCGAIAPYANKKSD